MATYVPPTVLTSPARKKRLLSLFRGNFAFGETDSTLTDELIHDLGTLAFERERIELVGIGTNVDRKDALLVNLKANLCETITHNFKLSPHEQYAVDGIAGLGKTTMLDKYGSPSGTDLQDLRDHPVYGVLCGLSEDNLYYRLKARQQLSRGRWLIDRSNHLAPTVYAAYARKAMFLYLDQQQQDFIIDEPYQTFVLKPNVPLVEVASRIATRGKMDREVPLAYTVLTYSMFNIAAYCYNIPIVPYDAFVRELEAVVSKTIEVDRVPKTTEVDGGTTSHE